MTYDIIKCKLNVYKMFNTKGCSNNLGWGLNRGVLNKERSKSLKHFFIKMKCYKSVYS